MAIQEPKKQFGFVVHRNGFNENVVVFDKGAAASPHPLWCG